jgi:hypothetical protein
VNRTRVAYRSDQLALRVESGAAIGAALAMRFHGEPFAVLQLVIQIKGNLF